MAVRQFITAWAHMKIPTPDLRAQGTGHDTQGRLRHTDSICRGAGRLTLASGCHRLKPQMSTCKRDLDVDLGTSTRY